MPAYINLTIDIVLPPNNMELFTNLDRLNIIGKILHWLFKNSCSCKHKNKKAFIIFFNKNKLLLLDGETTLTVRNIFKWNLTKQLIVIFQLVHLYELTSYGA